jgi:hypothetical protein
LDNTLDGGKQLIQELVCRDKIFTLVKEHEAQSRQVISESTQITGDFILLVASHHFAYKFHKHLVKITKNLC